MARKTVGKEESSRVKRFPRFERTIAAPSTARRRCCARQCLSVMSEVDEAAVTRHVESLRSRGVTTIALPEQLITQIQTTFESIKPGVLAHDQGSCGFCCRPCRKEPERHLSADALRFVVGDQSTGESGFNRHCHCSHHLSHIILQQRLV